MSRPKGSKNRPKGTPIISNTKTKVEPNQRILSFPIDCNYDRVFKEMYQDDLQKPMPESATERIKNLNAKISDTSLSPEQLEEAKLYFSNNPLTKSLVIPDPKRKTAAERCLSVKLKQICDNSNGNLIYDRAGRVYLGEEGEENNIKNVAKSMDFCITGTISSHNYFIIAKHTDGKTGGGAQDNQEYNVLEALKRAKRNKNSKASFIAVLDGSFYTADGEKRFNEIKTAYSSDKISVLHTSELETYFSNKD